MAVTSSSTVDISWVALADHGVPVMEYEVVWARCPDLDAQTRASRAQRLPDGLKALSDAAAPHCVEAAGGASGRRSPPSPPAGAGDKRGDGGAALGTRIPVNSTRVRPDSRVVAARGLKPGCHYAARVRARNTKGFGDWGPWSSAARTAGS